MNILAYCQMCSKPAEVTGTLCPIGPVNFQTVRYPVDPQYRDVPSRFAEVEVSLLNNFGDSGESFLQLGVLACVLVIWPIVRLAHFATVVT